MSEPTAKNAKLRNYRDLIMFGFVSADSKSMCLVCGTILTNDSMKNVNLEQYQILRHPSSFGTDFENWRDMTASSDIRHCKDDEYCKNRDTESKLFGF